MVPFNPVCNLRRTQTLRAGFERVLRRHRWRHRFRSWKTGGRQVQGEYAMVVVNNLHQEPTYVVQEVRAYPNEG